MKHFEEHVEDVSLILDEEECSDTKQTDMILDVGDRPQMCIRDRSISGQNRVSRSRSARSRHVKPLFLM